MNQFLKLYGFGSFFQFRTCANDIDLLLIHEDVSFESMRFAIRCKLLVKAEIPKAHVVMMSKQEESDFDFLNQSKGLLLGVISDTHLPTQIQQLVRRIL